MVWLRFKLLLISVVIIYEENKKKLLGHRDREQGPTQTYAQLSAV